MSNTPQTQKGAEWVEKRDAQGHLLFRYSPVRDVIAVKVKGEVIEINLHQLRTESVRELLKAGQDSGFLRPVLPGNG